MLKTKFNLFFVFSVLKAYLVEDEIGNRLEQEYFEENRGNSFGTKFYTNSREVTFTLEMEPGSAYIIVPSTFKSYQNGQFLIRFVSDQKLTCEEPL